MLTLVSQAPFDAVSVADLKAHLNIAAADTSQDTYLGSLLSAAKNYCERDTGMDFSATDWRLVLERFPGRRRWRFAAEAEYVYHSRREQQIVLPRGPVQSVTAVTYYDPSNALQTADPTLYYVTTPSFLPGLIQPATYWPPTASRPDAVAVSFTSGFASLPPAAAHAIKLLVGTWFAAREDISYGPGTAAGQAGQAVENLLGQIRPGRYA